MEAIALFIIVLSVVWIQELLFKKFVFHNLNYECRFSTDEAYEGDEITFVEVIHNNKPMPLQWLKAEIRTSRWLSFADTRSFIAQEIRHITSGYFLRMYQKTTRIWKVKCLKRGVFTIDKIILVSSDFFGITTRSIPILVDIKLVVYPGQVDLEDILLSTRNLQGDIIVKRWILDDPFVISGAKEYSYTEPMNRIHWQATARQGDLMVRKNDYTSNQSIRVFLNIQTVEYYHVYTIEKELIEFGIKLSATLLERATKYGIPVSFASNGCIDQNDSQYIFTPTASGSQHLKELMNTLAELELKISLGFDEFLGEVNPIIDESEVIIITAYLNDKALNEKINDLKRCGVSVKVILLREVYGESNLDEDVPVYTIKAGDIK